MSQSLGLNTSIAKEHTVLPKRIGRENPSAEQQQAVISQGPERDSGVRWEKVNSAKNEEGEFRISPSSDQVILSTSTVVTPEAVKASEQVSSLRENLRQKFIGLFEQAYANVFHHNRLVAKVAEWSVENIFERLALLGMSPLELSEIKDRVRENLIYRNQLALAQVVYDETMLEIVA